MKKGDFILIIAIIIIAVSIFFYINFYAHGDKGAQVIIKLENQIIKEISLPVEDKIEYKVEIDQENYNLVQIKDDRVRIKNANCPDQVCVNEGWKDKAGETLVCLPHQLVIEITGEDQDNEIDLKTY
jgi:hypothetical protein